jgi:hypothetical protein
MLESRFFDYNSSMNSELAKRLVHRDRFFKICDLDAVCAKCVARI